MKKIRILALLAAVMLFSLTGCSLAKPEAAMAEDGQDQLIGIFITKEYLDLFDFEAYFNDHIDEFASGGDVAIDDTSGYQNRIYAERTEQARGDGTVGYDYTFDLEGYGFYVPEITDGINTYTATCADDGIGDSSVNIGTNTLEVEATLFVTPTGDTVESSSWYLNPVYQTSDGEVYLTAGSGIGFTPGATSTGILMSQTLSTTTTITENGETREQTNTVTIHISVVDRPVSIDILEMDGEGNRLSKRSFAPEDVPETITPSEKTAYLIVVTHGTNPDGDAAITPEVYAAGADGGITTFRATDSGVCVQQWHEVLWPE